MKKVKATENDVPRFEAINRTLGLPVYFEIILN
jgi:hypothetical protein